MQPDPTWTPCVRRTKSRPGSRTYQGYTNYVNLYLVFSSIFLCVFLESPPVIGSSFCQTSFKLFLRYDVSTSRQALRLTADKTVLVVCIWFIISINKRLFKYLFYSEHHTEFATMATTPATPKLKLVCRSSYS